MDFVNSRKLDDSVVFNIPIMTTDDVTKIINSLSLNAATGLDGRSTRVLKLTPPYCSESY